MSSQPQDTLSSDVTDPSHLNLEPTELTKNHFPQLLVNIVDIVSGNLVKRCDNIAEYKYQKQIILKTINLEALQACPPKNGEELWRQFVYIVSQMEMSRRKIQSNSNIFVSYQKKWQCCSQCQFPSKTRFCRNCKKTRLKPLKPMVMMRSRVCQSCRFNVYLCMCKEVGLKTGQYL